MRKKLDISAYLVVGPENTLGSFTNYAEAHRAMPGVLKKLPDAYMVAFLNGQKVTIKQARAAERK